MGWWNQYLSCFYSACRFYVGGGPNNLCWTCPDGIICVGGDGIVNEVLNGLLNRNNQKEAISIPIGITPAGSDNSLVWTVLGCWSRLRNIKSALGLCATLLLVFSCSCACQLQLRSGIPSTSTVGPEYGKLVADCLKCLTCTLIVILGKSNADGLPRASSLSSIDSMMSPGMGLDTIAYMPTLSHLSMYVAWI